MYKLHSIYCCVCEAVTMQRGVYRVSVLPEKAKEERKYPHVTADPTWMRLITATASYAPSPNAPNPTLSADVFYTLCFSVVASSSSSYETTQPQ